jgi:hypothetical protein
MRKLLSLLVAVVFLSFVSCGGVMKAVDVVTESPYDTNKSCKQLEAELAASAEVYKEKEKAVSSKNGANAVVVVAGLVLAPFLLLLVDPSSTDADNYSLAVSHYNYILNLCVENDCEIGDMEPVVIVEVVKTASESNQDGN